MRGLLGRAGGASESLIPGGGIAVCPGRTMELVGTHNHFAMEALNVRYIKGYLNKCLVHFLIKTLKDI